MKVVEFDFDNIDSLASFYKEFRNLFGFSYKELNNLDALWDSLTGGLDLPIGFKFLNLTLTKLETFSNLISLFEDASQEEYIEFSYYLKK